MITEKKVAILRGINVGGNRKILMEDLKSICSKIGMQDIKTYIQSGNIIFRSSNTNVDLERTLEKEINQNYGFEVPVIVRTLTELKAAVEKNPFYTSDIDISKLHLTLLKNKPSHGDLYQTQTYNYEPDQFYIENKNVFIYCEGKYHKSKLSNNFFEKQLRVQASTRNWKTILKLVELSNS